MSICQSLKDLTSLESLYLSFSYSKVTKKTLAELSNSLITLQNLKKVQLEFRGCTKVKAKALDKVKDSLKKIDGLTPEQIHIVCPNQSQCCNIF